MAEAGLCPAPFGVTGLAVVTQITSMALHLVFFGMTCHAAGGQLRFFRTGNVTALTFGTLVFISQRELSLLVVVKPGQIPFPLTVARLTFVTQSLLMLVILQVTGNAARWRLDLERVNLVTRVTTQGCMTFAQREVSITLVPEAGLLPA
jgi:hypothetical protein